MMASYFQMNTASSLGSGSLPSNTLPNPQADHKVITTRSGVTLAGPLVSPLSTEVNREPETITDQVLTESTNNVPPLVVQPSPVSTSFSTISSSKMPEVTKDTVQSSTENIQPSVAQTQVPIDEPVVSPKPKPTIPYPSRANKQKLREKDDMLALKFKKLSFPELTSTQMILELADRSMTRPAGIAEDVFVKVGKFHFLTDFVVVDYVVDPRVPLILERPFLSTGQALIDVYGKELTLRVNDEAITFKIGQTSKYSYNNVESINRIDVIDVAEVHFMVKEGIFLDHKISKSGIKVDRAKVNVIAKLPHPTSVKVLSKTIVYTDHSALKYLLAKQDAKPRLIWWILLLQESNFIIRDKKRAENLAAYHLSRLENPHQDELENKEIIETFPLETLGMIAFRGDSSTSWFADSANYHAGNFIVKGMSSQQKKKFFKDLKHYFWTTPICLRFVLIK
nr:reverse transcriptase domain-containing protein [Tanacetum cinerariifolium]